MVTVLVVTVCNAPENRYAVIEGLRTFESIRKATVEDYLAARIADETSNGRLRSFVDSVPSSSKRLPHQLFAGVQLPNFQLVLVQIQTPRYLVADAFNTKIIKLLEDGLQMK